MPRKKPVMENLLKLIQRIRSKIYTHFIYSLFYSIGNRTSIIPPLRFSNLKYIELGSGVTIHGNCWIQTIESSCESKQIVPKLILKDNVSIGMGSTISAAAEIIIEEYVFTARNVYISDHNHAFSDVSRPIGLQGIDKIVPVKIGAHSWLGQNSVVLPGVTVGRHCVIGANAVVTKSVPDYSIVAGIPARIIKHYNFNDALWEKVSVSR
jgi:acetyltransferase-like isoleucine patch superfamily enzyme